MKISLYYSFDYHRQILYNYNVTICEMECEKTLSYDPDMYNTIYKEMIDLVGIECTQKIYKEFNGQQISFPTRLYSPAYVERKVIERFNGSNIKELAKEYGYTDRWIRKMLKKNLIIHLVHHFKNTG